MSLIKLHQYCLHYGEQLIFNHLDFQLDKGKKLCITGRNGVGKSTLLACIAGCREVDSGERWLKNGAKVAFLSQELPVFADQNVYDFVSQGIEGLGEQLAQYHALSHCETPDLVALERLQHAIEEADGWRLQNRVEQIITRLDLDADAPMSSLSGGWRRRAALAQVLLSEPDILLLDEPTNHLDLEAIAWLEDFLQSWEGALVFITHDRAFLRKLANTVGELDRGKLTLWDGNYDDFVAFREHQLATEEREQNLFDKRLAEEEAWIRQGVKARRTRNEGRVRALQSMREERAARIEKAGTVKLEIAAGALSGKRVSELDQVCFRYADKPVIKDLSCIVQRGDKVGIIGPNGSGKTTLLKIILGQLEPSGGLVRLGTKMEVAWFDQQRLQLDPEKDARENVAGGQDFIEINGRKLHVMSYLKDFMFTGERARTPIKTLSGGERNRILLARLFSKPANLLVMDEPTNDLDMETLELLEEKLINFQGTLLLVSHDREFMDNIVTSTLVFEGEGVVNEYVGGYSDWRRQRARGASQAREDNDTKSRSKIKAIEKKPRKLSYKFQRELNELPRKIEKKELLLAEIEQEIATETFYQQDRQFIEARLEALAKIQHALKTDYARWEELEGMSE